MNRTSSERFPSCVLTKSHRGWLGPASPPPPCKGAAPPPCVHAWRGSPAGGGQGSVVLQGAAPCQHPLLDLPPHRAQSPASPTALTGGFHPVLPESLSGLSSGGPLRLLVLGPPGGPCSDSEAVRGRMSLSAPRPKRLWKKKVLRVGDSPDHCPEPCLSSPFGRGGGVQNKNMWGPRRGSEDAGEVWGLAGREESLRALTDTPRRARFCVFYSLQLPSEGGRPEGCGVLRGRAGRAPRRPGGPEGGGC